MDNNIDIVNYDDNGYANYGNDSDSPVRLNARENAGPLAILGLGPFGQTTSSETFNF